MKKEKFREKIKKPDELKRILGGLKSRGKKIVQCHGAFDLLHRAHLYHFEQAKDLGDVLVVSVTTDKFVNKGPNRPVFNENMRAEMIAALGLVDYVVLSNAPSSVELIKLLKPDTYVKGMEYCDHKNDPSRKIVLEQKAVESLGGRIFFSQEMPYHSSAILNEFLPVFPLETQNWLRQFKKDHDSSAVISQMRELKKMKCMLIGEAIADEYCYVKALGKPTKGSHLAVDIINSEIQAGGILAAANHLAGFCDEVTVLACVGSDDKADVLRGLLKPNVKADFFKRDGKTIVKKRFIERHSFAKLFQTYEGNIGSLPDNLESKLSGKLDRYFRDKKYDINLVIDYGHGFLSERTASFISARASWLALSTQANTANFGHNLVTKYPKASYVCIDEPELRLAAHDQWGDVKNLTAGLLRSDSNNFERLILTRGGYGCLVPIKGSSSLEIPSFSNKVIDAVGAGDAFIAVTSLCLKAGMPIELVGFIGNAVGALAVGTLGNRSSIEPMTLFNFINTLLR